MADYRHRINAWLSEGAQQNATHMLLVFDAYGDDEFPLFVHPGLGVARVLATLVSEVQVPVYCFSYRTCLEAQLEALLSMRSSVAHLQSPPPPLTVSGTQPDVVLPAPHATTNTAFNSTSESTFEPVI